MKIKAWYFAAEDNKLCYGDGREIVVGETHTVEGEPKLYENGLHASERIIEALPYAPCPILYQVELSGKFDKGDDKLCATERTYIKRIDATELLREFARKQALINIEKIKPYTDKYGLIVEYLKTGNENLASAAESAARKAAWYAAWYSDESAEAAAWSAASAAESAAESAAWYAARYAAESAAEFDGYAAANDMLEMMVAAEANKG